jgi:uncharacterized protein
MVETVFSPYLGISGGMLIGLSAILLLATAGRIAGASGIFGGVLTTKFDETFRWRAIFLIGLLLGAALVAAVMPAASEITYATTPAMTVISGLIVGIGVTLASGCTSGHGICGLSLFSQRSLIATVTFMLVAFITVYVTRHVMGV